MDKLLSEVIANAPLFGKKRKAFSPADFGDEQTIGLQLKRRDKTFMDLGDHDFGVYLGSYNGKYHVGTYVMTEWTPTKLMSYKSLLELKNEWILD